MGSSTLPAATTAMNAYAPHRHAPSLDTREPLEETYDALVGLFRSAGVERIESLELPGAAPILTGEIPAPTCDAWPMAPNRRPRA